MMLRHIACVKYCTMNKGSNAMYVKGVKSSSIYTVRAVMLSCQRCQKKLNIHYRSGMVNSKSFISKVLLRIKWKFDLINTL